MLYKLYCKNVGFCLTFLRIFGNFISFTSGISLLLKLYKPLVMHETGSCLIYYPSQIWQHVLQNVKSAKTYFDEKTNKYSFSHILKRFIETQHSYKLATMRALSIF